MAPLGRTKNMFPKTHLIKSDSVDCEDCEDSEDCE